MVCDERNVVYDGSSVHLIQKQMQGGAEKQMTKLSGLCTTHKV